MDLTDCVFVLSGSGAFGSSPPPAAPVGGPSAGGRLFLNPYAAAG